MTQTELLYEDIIERGGVWEILPDRRFTCHPRTLLTKFETEFIKNNREAMMNTIVTASALQDIKCGRDRCAVCGEVRASYRAITGEWYCDSCRKG